MRSLDVLAGRRAVAAAIYEGAVGLLGCAALLYATCTAGRPGDLRAALLFLLLAIALKREGFRVAHLVTHSLAGIAALAALVALGRIQGAWVAALSGSLFLASRIPEADRPAGAGRLRLALFGGGLNALMALAGAALYQALGGSYGPAALTWRDLVPLAGLALTWFLIDHVGWSVCIALEGGTARLGSFLRAIYGYSIAVELLPLPIGAVVAVAYAAAGLPAFILLAVALVAAGAVLWRLSLTLDRAHARVAGLTALTAFSRALLAAKLDVLELCRLLHAHTSRVVDAQRSWLALYDPRQGTLETVVASGAAAPAPGLLNWLQNERAPLLVRDATRERLPFAPVDAGFRSTLMVPLQAAGTLIGMLAVESSAPGAYSDGDLGTIAAFANLTAMAIQNARSLEAEQRRARQLATIGEVSRRVVAIVGMERLFSGVVHLIRDTFGYYDVQLFTIDSAGGQLVFQASTTPAIQERGIAVARGQGLVGWVAETGQQAVIDDVAAEPRFRTVEGLERTRSEAVVPLKIEERLVGILDVQSDRPHAFGEEDLFVLRTLADQVAIAIEDNRLYRAEKARRQLADTLLEMAGALNSTLELQVVLDLVLTQLQRVLHYDGAAILEWEDGHFCIVAGRGPRYAGPDRCLTLAEDAGLRRLVVERAPIVFAAADRPGATALAVPLLVMEHLFGALIIERLGATSSYAPEEIGVVAAFANQAAVAIENARLYEAEQRRSRELATVAEVGQRVASILDLDELFVQIVELVRQEFGYYHVSIFTVEGDTGGIAFRASTSQRIRERGLAVRSEAGIIGWVVTHGEALVANDVAAEPRYEADEALPDTRAELAVPLRVEGRTVGILDIQSDRPGAFGPEDLFVTQTLADQVAVAIENARLYAAQQEEAWVSTALLQVAESLANLIGVDEVLDAVIRLLPLLVGVDRCAIFLRDQDAGHYQAARVHGLPAALREAFLAQTLEALAPALWQAGTQAPAPAPLDLREAGLAHEAERALGVAGGMALPLRAGGETIGVLLAGYEQATAPLGRSHRAILTGIANQAAMAIQNARLYVAQREEAWVSTALLQVSELAGRTRNLDEILASLVRLTPMLGGVDRCCVFLWDRERGRYVASQAYGLHDELRERFGGLRFAPGEFPLLDQVRAGRELVLAEAGDTARLVPAELAHASGAASALALPLRTQDEVLGVMLVDHAGPAHRFSQQRIALLAGIANQAALAIENVQLYHESLENERMAQELAVARQIQATFLPEACPKIPGWSVAATSRPAREVGGDFYDFIALGERLLGLVIADVSDKGVPAALFMALSRAVMRASAVEGRSPAATLGRVNDLLLADTRSGMFVTLFYGILDTASGQLVYGSAGHNPPFWRPRRSRRLVRLASRGIALGVIEQPLIDEAHITLQPGDALVLYTDGVTESFDLNEREFGEGGLQKAIHAAGPVAAAPLVAAINQAVHDFVCGAPQHDDYTLLAIARDP